MTRIDPGSNPLAYLQEQARQIAAPGGPKPPPNPGVKGQPPPADWMELVARSVAAISPNDPERRRKAFKIFLTAGLAREFGIEDRQGAEFTHLIEGVYEAMLANPRIGAAVDRAGDLLLQSGRPPLGGKSGSTR